MKRTLLMAATVAAALALAACQKQEPSAPKTGATPPASTAPAPSSPAPSSSTPSAPSAPADASKDAGKK